MTLSPSKPRPKSRARLLLPMMAAGLVVAGLGLMMTSRGDSMTVSEVRREITALVLAKSTRPGFDDGGMIGFLHISAKSADPLTGELQNLRIDGDNLLIAAKRATILIDPQKDTITFQLHAIEMVSTNDDGKSGADGDGSAHFLNHLDQHLLGPIPWKANIVVDG